MAKKTAKKKAKKVDKDLSLMEQLISRQTSIIETQMEALENDISSMSGDGESKQTLRDKIVASTNSLTKSLTAVSAEQRQLEKHVQIKLDRLTPAEEDAVFMRYLNQLPRPRRQQFLSKLQELDSNNDLLSL